MRPMRSTRRVTAAVVLGLLVCLSGVNSRAQEQALVWARFEQYLDALRRQAGIPGLSGVILKDRQVVWQAGFGLADVAGNVPATPDTPFHVAGLTQALSTVLLLQCAEQGLVDLDAPLRAYVPAAADPEGAATLRQLLMHTAEPAADGGPAPFRYDLAHLAVLTPVIEGCLKVPFREALAHGLLDVAGLAASVPGHDMEDPATLAQLSLEAFDEVTRARYLEILGRLATPYAVDGAGRPTPSDYPARSLDAGGGLVTTAADLARFDVALTPWVDETEVQRWLLLSPATLQAAWTAPGSSAGTAIGPSAVPTGRQPHGLGWFVQDYQGQRVVWQFGVVPSASSSIVIKVPDRQLTLVLLANSDGLVAPFGLEAGDVTTSVFAQLFLRLFL